MNDKKAETERLDSRLTALENENICLKETLNEKAIELQEVIVKINQLSQTFEATKIQFNSLSEVSETIARNVTDIVVKILLKRQDDFEKINYSKLDFLTEQIAILSSLLKTENAKAHAQPTSSTSSKSSSLGDTVRSSNNKNKKYCDLCEQLFDTQKAMKNHMRIVHQET